MDEDTLYKLDYFKFEPILPLRSDLVGDMVFYKNWQEIVQLPESYDAPANARFARILGNYGGEFSQRSASVATSFVCWLGSNIGQCFLKDVHQEVEKHSLDSKLCYLMVWTRENRRIANVNSGRRLLELILRDAPNSNTIPVLTVDDYEVVEQITIWLATEAGQEFLVKCNQAVDQHFKNKAFENHVRYGLNIQCEQADALLMMARDYNP